MPKSVHSARHKAIADALAAQRKAKGLSQEKLAKALGRYQPFIANIESGERRVDLVELIRIADLIDLDLRELIERVRRIPADD